MLYAVYVKSFEGENFCSSSVKLNMWENFRGCFATNPKTIHMCSSSVYGVLELEKSHALWQKKQENLKLTVLSVVIVYTKGIGHWKLNHVSQS